MLDNAAAAQAQWRQVSLDDRISLCRRFVGCFETLGPQISSDLTVQMGRPTCQGMVEVNGTIERAYRMIDLAVECLKDVTNPVRLVDSYMMHS